MTVLEKYESDMRIEINENDLSMQDNRRQFGEDSLRRLL